jgi:hypothetical protein
MTKTKITTTAQLIVAQNENGVVTCNMQGRFRTYQNYESFTRSVNVKSTENTIRLNELQRIMYRRLMYGIKDYTAEQISQMSTKSIADISIAYKKAQKVLHILKAKKYYAAENNLMRALFPKQNIGDYEEDWTMIPIPKHVTLKKLNINVKEIVDEFIKHKLLPNNFYTLSPNTVSL